MNIKKHYEDEAKKLFLKYHGNYFQICRDELFDKYKEYNISRELEIKWLFQEIERKLKNINITNELEHKKDIYIEIFELFKNLKDNLFLEENKVLLIKVINFFEKDLIFLDLFTITIIINLFFENKKNMGNSKKKLKKILMNYVINEDKILFKSDEIILNITEEEVKQDYQKILLNLEI